MRLLIEYMSFCPALYSALFQALLLPRSAAANRLFLPQMGGFLCNSGRWNCWCHAQLTRWLSEMEFLQITAKTQPLFSLVLFILESTRRWCDLESTRSIFFFKEGGLGYLKQGWASSWLVSLNIWCFSTSRDSTNHTLTPPLGLVSARRASCFVSLCVPSPQSDESWMRWWPLVSRFQLSWLILRPSSSSFLCHLLHHAAVFTQWGNRLHV